MSIIIVPPNVITEAGGGSPAQNAWGPPEVDPVIAPPTLSQPEWFIDPVNGRDSNSGATLSSALRTLAELSRRWGADNVLTPASNVTTVTLVSNIPASDPLNFDTGLAPGGTLIFQGGPPVESPLPINATVPVRARVRATNTPWALTLTSSAAPFVGARIRDVTQSTLLAPACCYGIKNEGADVLRISEPVTYPGVGNDIDPVANRFTPVATDTYVVQALVQFTPGAMTLNGGSGTLAFQDVQIDAPFSILTDLGVQIFLYGVVGPFGSFVQLGSTFLNNVLNCLFSGPIDWVVGSFNIFQAGALLAHAPPVNFVVDINCTIRLDIDVIFQGLMGGATVLTGTRWLLGTVGIFDSVPGGPGGQNPTGDGVHLTPGADGAVSFVDTDVTNQIWGHGNAGAGIAVASNGSFQYDPSVNATPMSVTGAGGDFTLAGSNASFAPQNNGSTIGPFADTWVNLFGGTFPNGVAIDPIYGAKITPFH